MPYSSSSENPGDDSIDSDSDDDDDNDNGNPVGGGAIPNFRVKHKQRSLDFSSIPPPPPTAFEMFNNFTSSPNNTVEHWRDLPVEHRAEFARLHERATRYYIRYSHLYENRPVLGEIQRRYEEENLPDGWNTMSEQQQRDWYRWADLNQKRELNRRYRRELRDWRRRARRRNSPPEESRMFRSWWKDRIELDPDFPLPEGYTAMSSSAQMRVADRLWRKQSASRKAEYRQEYETSSRGWFHSPRSLNGDCLPSPRHSEAHGGEETEAELERDVLGDAAALGPEAAPPLPVPTDQDPVDPGDFDQEGRTGLPHEPPKAPQGLPQKPQNPLAFDLDQQTLLDVQKFLDQVGLELARQQENGAQPVKRGADQEDKGDKEQEEEDHGMPPPTVNPAPQPQPLPPVPTITIPPPATFPQAHPPAADPAPTGQPRKRKNAVEKLLEDLPPDFKQPKPGKRNGRH